MGEKDISEKILADYNDVFADIINGLIFDGRAVVDADRLENASERSQYKEDGSRLHEQERDVVKFWNGDKRIRLAILGIENQTRPDPFMPARIVSYDGASYRRQLSEEKNRKTLVPTVTLILHFGTDKRWDKPTSLRKLLRVPKGLERFVNDYKIYVVDVAWLSEEQIGKFHSDFRVVANFFRNKRLNKEYVPDDPTEIRHVDEVLKLLSVMTNDWQYEELLAQPAEGKELRNMCEVAERLVAKGIVQGRAEGIAEGRTEGRTEGRIGICVEMINDGESTLAKALKRLHMTEPEFRKAVKEYGFTLTAV